MSSFQLQIDPREAQYARLVGNALSVLRMAVARRTSDGVSQAAIGARIDMDKGQLSRILNGRVRNITLRTMSDILWAAEHEPAEISADAIEDISPNYCPLHRREVVTTTSPDTLQWISPSNEVPSGTCVWTTSMSMQTIGGASLADIGQADSLKHIELVCG